MSDKPACRSDRTRSEGQRVVEEDGSFGRDELGSVAFGRNAILPILTRVVPAERL